LASQRSDFEDVKSRFATALVAIVSLTVAGFVAEPVGERAWEFRVENEPALDIHNLEGLLGQGVTVALLGGFRAVVADVLWLQTNSVWEDVDLPACQSLINITTAIDPRPLYFWINGARMIAYDMPVWRINAAGGPTAVPEDIRRRIEREQAEAALLLIGRGLRQHPNEPLLLIEIANIRLRKLDDLEGAILFYRLASEQAGAPFYAARICGELLRQAGRTREAYDWLCETHRNLPRNNPMALAGHVFERIRRLETELGIPESERYVRGRTTPAAE
jgi:hypothetical protein